MYVQSLEKKESPETLGLMEDEEEEEKEDVNLDNVKKEFILGYNKISFEYSLVDEGILFLYLHNFLPECIYGG